MDPLPCPSAFLGGRLGMNLYVPLREFLRAQSLHRALPKGRSGAAEYQARSPLTKENVHV